MTSFTGSYFSRYLEFSPRHLIPLSTAQVFTDDAPSTSETVNDNRLCKFTFYFTLLCLKRGLHCPSDRFPLAELMGRVDGPCRLGPSTRVVETGP